MATIKKHRLYIFIAAGLLLFAFIFYYFTERTSMTYGNDEPSITKVIQSLDGYDGKQIEILEITDFHDNRVAAFLADNKPGYIQFTRNSEGNYEWRTTENGGNPLFAKGYLD
ncbi:hypothetical protein M3231_06775 [Neobacillus mesonae]|nr:hypothetical protein [Neobacillus mesonae]